MSSDEIPIQTSTIYTTLEDTLTALGPLVGVLSAQDLADLLEDALLGRDLSGSIEGKTDRLTELLMKWVATSVGTLITTGLSNDEEFFRAAVLHYIDHLTQDLHWNYHIMVSTPAKGDPPS